MAILDELRGLSSAEDFFRVLGVSHEPEVLQVARLHILKRMGQYLASADMSGLDEDAIRAACQETLARAYADFVRSSPLAERVFKVLRERDPQAPARKGAFVPLTALFDTLERT